MHSSLTLSSNYTNSCYGGYFDLNHMSIQGRTFTDQASSGMVHYFMINRVNCTTYIDTNPDYCTFTMHSNSINLINTTIAKTYSMSRLHAECTSMYTNRRSIITSFTFVPTDLYIHLINGFNYKQISSEGNINL